MIVAQILLVEDDRDVRVLLQHVLLDAGFAVTAVETAAKALRLIETQPFDLVVTDGKLGDGTGIDIADKATAQGVKVLIVTGHALQLPQERLRHYDYLLKPFRPSELLEAIRQRRVVSRGDPC